jgi:hypothetical protein
MFEISLLLQVTVCSFFIYILGGMYFYVTMVYIVPYTDLTVFPVTNYPSYARATATTSIILCQLLPCCC